MRGKYPRACAVFRIFTTLRYRSTFRSSRWRSRWMIPSERKSSPYWQNLSLSCSISVIRRDVIPSSRNHSKSRNSSSRGSSNFPMTSKAGSESITRRPMSTVLSRLSMYILNTSIHDLFDSCFSFFRINERSSTLSFFSSPETSMPSPAMFASRDSRLCSSVTYTAPRPSSRAFWKSMWNERDDFIVPGFPARRTTCPAGIPPCSCSSRPRTYVRIRSSAMVSPPRMAPLLLELYSPSRVRPDRSRRDEAEDPAEDDEQAPRKVALEDQEADADHEVPDAPDPVLAPVRQEGADDRGEREDPGDRDLTEPVQELLAASGEPEAEQDEQRPEEPHQEGEDRQEPAFAHGGA